MLTGKKLKMIRALVGMTQTELARKAELSATAVVGFELGKREIRTSTVRKLCEVLGVEVTYIVNGTTISGP